MSVSRLLPLGLLTLAVLANSAPAQRRFDQRLPPPRDLQFYEPRNKLEELEGMVETVLIKGRTYVGTLRVPAGVARVEATEIRNTRTPARASGVIIAFVPNDANASAPEIRSAIDYEEIDPLVKAMDLMVKTDDSVTKLSHFEIRYRTRGDFEAAIVKQINGSVVVSIEGGFFDRTRFFLTPDELTKLRWLIAQAKEKLDEIK
jgi:hypothetical protein